LDGSKGKCSDGQEADDECVEDRVAMEHPKAWWSCLLSQRGAFVLALLGAAGFVSCYLRHICMEGHMKHPPYGAGEYWLDVAWTLAWVLAAIGFARTGSRIGVTFAVVLPCLVIYRLVLGSAGGLLPFI